MRDITRDQSRVHRSYAGRFLMGILVVSMTACGVSQRSAQRADEEVSPAWPGEFTKASLPFQAKQLPILRVAYPEPVDAEYVNDDELCLTCHQVYAESFGENVHRGIHESAQACEACHGPASQHLKTRGKEPGTILSFKNLPPTQAAEVCLKCHEENACSPGAQWRTSVHAHNCVTCTNCHRAHYNVPPGTPATSEPDANAMSEPATRVHLASFEEAAADLPSLRGTSYSLGAIAPQVCYQCHGDKADMQNIAGPHQIGGANCFNCTTCHDAHGKILESSRKDLCLQCHNQHAPTMAFNSSTHNLMGVACTDCHFPHPNANVPQMVNISYAGVTRPQRMPMSVNQPGACYKCHPAVFAQFSLPSHHPVVEGKMICSDCHDGHGQMAGNFKAEWLNLLCWKCHADKQGPFAYEHPPVTENCAYCHAPHGTVANNLLKQNATFLCMRCHRGHRTGIHGHEGGHPPAGTTGGIGLRADVDRNPAIREALYTDCTTCHTQIHGSDVPTGHNPGVLMR